MKPLIKWAGGKRGEIAFLAPHYPKAFTRVVEPFAGGAAVAWDLDGVPALINDVNQGLVAFYRCMLDGAQRQALRQALDAIDARRAAVRAFVAGLDEADINGFFAAPSDWLTRHAGGLHAMVAGSPWPGGGDAGMARLITKHVASKAGRIVRLEDVHGGAGERRVHIETALQSAVYEALRNIYNGDAVACEGLTEAWRSAAWWAVRTLCYSGMFRFGRDGRFNVPYGGMGYNGRTFASGSEDMFGSERVTQLARFTVESLDFGSLFERHHGFRTSDFLFIDPPYDSAFSQYNREGDFTRDDQARLRDALLACKAQWMLVIKRTDFIESLYRGQPGTHCHVFDKRYMANFRNRHGRDVQHLVVTGYPLAVTAGSALRPLAEA